MRAGSLLELDDSNPVSQLLCGWNAMITSKNADEKGLEDVMVLLHKGLQSETETKYGRDMVIPHSALDDELMGAMLRATPTAAV